MTCFSVSVTVAGLQRGRPAAGVGSGHEPRGVTRLVRALRRKRNERQGCDVSPSGETWSGGRWRKILKEQADVVSTGAREPRFGHRGYQARGDPRRTR